MGNQRRSIPLPLTQGAETFYYVSRHWRRRNQIKNGANSLSPSKRCPEAPPYFQAHPVIVLTITLRNILHKPDLTGECCNGPSN
ncbi:hypothetical protein CK203_036595 [Vitis vinifera]|uniref:Uncharacterized protein n=1 Tax=Vitis vinifera TaxID=29760 RepID=A0A438HIK8_VITVI|nr:hypothetical protein CK203_036595 [Vitis vinifera]